MMTATTAGKTQTAALRQYLLIVLAGWAVVGLGALEYARMKGVPGWAAGPIAAAFLIELPFYLLPGFPILRGRLAVLGRPALAVLMAVSAVIPYLVYSVPTGVFSAPAFGMLLLIGVATAFWYVALPRSRPTDALFLAFLAAVILTRVFSRIYADPVPRLHMEYLGHVMLIPLAAMAVLNIRGGSGAQFRFWPTASEWIAGTRWFAIALPCAAAVYWTLGLVQWRERPLPAALAVATFFGVLWVLALSEEFFFRGLLQHWLEEWVGGWKFALVLASVLFGAAHLGFAHRFPNWRFSVVAAVAGIFYGFAWRETRSVQSSMVTHALLVTVWRVFLK